MKKEMILIGVIVLTLLLISSVYAYSFDIERKCSSRKQYRINLDFDGNSNGYVMLTKGEWARANVFKLTPYESYALVYTDNNGNKVCINHNQATRNGALHIAQFEFDYSCMTKDELKDGLSIVPFNSVDCSQHIRP